MSELLDAAIRSVRQSEAAWCRFITGNDTGRTGSHQAGFYIPKCASTLLFDKPGLKGENKEKVVNIKWQDNFETESCMKYYGQGTRNEYRITRFGRDFPFLQDENVGSLLVIAKFTEDEYGGYVLSSDEDIDGFFACFNLSPEKTNQLIDVTGSEKPDEKMVRFFREFVDDYDDFPETGVMAVGARECYNKAYRIADKKLVSSPDEILMNWNETEYKLFQFMEEKFYGNLLVHTFESVEAFVQKANQVLNRRKSRAGKSLEHHLACIFTANNLIFEQQAVTEDNKKPDFLFPNSGCYHDLTFPTADLTVLGVKTTCKDRWRQVLSEADRVQAKHLFTLQPALSRNQLREMYNAHLTLVVPRSHIPNYPKEYQDRILNLAAFIRLVSEKQERVPKHFFTSPPPPSPPAQRTSGCS